MQVRPHLSLHDTVDDLPLITKAATVTGIDAMDRNRNDRVLAALLALLDTHGTGEWWQARPAPDAACRRWIRRRLDDVDHVSGGAPLNRFLPPEQRRGVLGTTLAALQERYLRPYPSLLQVTVEPPTPIAFLPGQYVTVRHHGTARPYSIASSPNHDGLRFCIRTVTGGQFTADLPTSLSVGDQVTLRGPYGEFVMEPPSQRDVVMLATGTGVAPLKSMVDYIFEEGLDGSRDGMRDVWLFLGAAWADDLPYADTFRALAADRANFHFVPTLTREAYLSDWSGETAYVHHVFVKYLAEEAVSETVLGAELAPFLGDSPREPITKRLHPDDIEVYACGLNAMVHQLVDVCKRLGLPPEHTQFEGFG